MWYNIIDFFLLTRNCTMDSLCTNLVSICMRGFDPCYLQTQQHEKRHIFSTLLLHDRERFLSLRIFIYENSTICEQMQSNLMPFLRSRNFMAKNCGQIYSRAQRPLVRQKYNNVFLIICYLRVRSKEEDGRSRLLQNISLFFFTRTQCVTLQKQVLYVCLSYFC